MGVVRVEILTGSGRLDQATPPNTLDLRVGQDRQVGPVGMDLHHGQLQLGRGPPQQRRAGSGGQPPADERVEVTVRGQQLVGVQSLVQPVRQRLLPSRPRTDLGSEERMRAALGQRHHPRLRVDRPVVPGSSVAERGGILLRVGHLDLEPVDRQQPPAPQPHPAGDRLADRAGDLLEHLGQHLTAQPLTRLRDPTQGSGVDSVG